MGQSRKTDEELHPENYFHSSKGHIKDRIIINESPKIPKEGVYLGLNGVAYLIKPGVEVDIPRPLRKMLDTRIETETTQDDQGKDHRRHMRRITYMLIKEDVGGIPEPEVIDAVENSGAEASNSAHS